MATIVEAFTQKLTIDTTDFAKGSKEAEQMLNYLKGAMGKENTEMERVAKGVGYAMERVQHLMEGFLGLTLSFTGFKNLIFGAAESTSAIGHLADALGISTQALDTWQRTVAAVGGNASSVSELFTKMKFDVVKYQMDYLHRPEKWMVMLNNAGVPWDVILDPDPSKPIMYLSRMLEQKRQRGEWSQAKVRTYVEELTSDIAFQDLILSGPVQMQQALDRMSKAGAGGRTPAQDKAARHVLLQLAQLRFVLQTFSYKLLAAVDKGIVKVQELARWLTPEAENMQVMFDNVVSSLEKLFKDASETWLMKTWIWLHCGGLFAAPREMEDEVIRFYAERKLNENYGPDSDQRSPAEKLGTPPDEYGLPFDKPEPWREMESAASEFYHSERYKRRFWTPEQRRREGQGETEAPQSPAAVSSAPAAASQGASDEALAFVKAKEGAFHSRAWWDKGKWSIGYGTSSYQGEGPITEAEAASRQRTQMNKDAAEIDAMFPGLNDKQRLALQSLSFNVGTDWLRGKTKESYAGQNEKYRQLREAIKSGDTARVQQIIRSMTHSEGAVMPELQSRRNEEAEIYGQPAKKKVGPQSMLQRLPKTGAPAAAIIDEHNRNVTLNDNGSLHFDKIIVHAHAADVTKMAKDIHSELHQVLHEG